MTDEMGTGMDAATGAKSSSPSGAPQASDEALIRAAAESIQETVIPAAPKPNPFARATPPQPASPPAPAPTAPAVQPTSINPAPVRTDVAKALGGIALPERRTFAAQPASSAPIIAKAPSLQEATHVEGELRKKEKEVAAQKELPKVVTIASAAEGGESAPLVRSLHTLKDDLQDMVRVRKMSLVRAAALESERREHEPEDAAVVRAAENRARRFRSFVLTLITFVGLGALALVAVAYVYQSRIAPSPPTRDASLLFAEQTRSFPISGLEARDIKSQLAQARTQVNLSLGAIARITPTVVDAMGERPARAGEFLQAIAPNVPDTLIRALQGNLFFGVHAIDQNAPLLVLPVTSYQNAFGAMIVWEATMNEDLAPIFPRVYREELDQSGAPKLARFEDVIIRNYDVRALKDERGEIQMLYAFPTRDILIIAESSHSFVEALARLRADRKI